MLNEGTKVSMKEDMEGDWNEGDIAKIIEVDFSDHTFPYLLEFKDSGKTEWAKADDFRVIEDASTFNGDKY